MNQNLFISPCVGLCSLDRDSQICIGCGRSKDEITKWFQLSYDEKMLIMKRLGYAKRTTRAKRKKSRFVKF